MGILKGENGEEAIFLVKMAVNFPEIIKDMKHQIEEAH